MKNKNSNKILKSVKFGMVSTALLAASACSMPANTSFADSYDLYSDIYKYPAQLSPAGQSLYTFSDGSLL